MQEIHYFSVLFLNDTFKFNYHQLISTQQQHLCSKCWWPELSDHYQESSRGRSRDTDGISGHSPRHAAAGSAALHRPRHRHHHPGLHNHRSWLFWMSRLHSNDCSHFVRILFQSRIKVTISSYHNREIYLSCCCHWMKQSPHYSSTMISWQNVCSTVQCIQLNTKTSKFFSFEKWFLGLPPPNS